MLFLAVGKKTRENTSNVCVEVRLIQVCFMFCVVSCFAFPVKIIIRKKKKSNKEGKNVKYTYMSTISSFLILNYSEVNKSNS